MSDNEPSSEDYLEIAEKVRSGEYFREARNMYDIDVHDPMSERYWYVILTVISVVIVTVTLFALQSLYPLRRSVPFIFATNDIVEDLPRMKSLLDHEGEDPNVALVRFLVTNYVRAREEYDIQTFDRNQQAIQSQSSDGVFREFVQYVDPNNPQSPIVLYQRHTTRSVKIISSEPLQDKEFGMRVIYDVTLKRGDEAKTSRFQADVAFKYEGIKLDEKTGAVQPYGFLVTGYRTKGL